MRNTKAKQLRKIIYGDYSIRDRKYFKLENGSIIADKRRRTYQAAKRWVRLVRAVGGQG